MSDGERAVYLYGVVPSAAQAAIEVGGIGAAPVRRIACGRIAALAGDVTRGPLGAARDLRAHWGVLEHAAERLTVLPIRFGTVLESDDAVRDGFLAPNEERFAAQLAELEGTVQLTVKGFYAEETLLHEVVREAPEVARLRERVRALPEAAGYYERIRLGELVAAEIDKRRTRDAERVLDRLAPLAVAAKAEAPAARDGAVDAAFLVRRDGIDRFSDAVQRLHGELGERMRISYIGPLPPYSFAEEAAWA